MIKRILKYLWRDKIDLVMFLITIVTFFVVMKDVTFAHGWMGFCVLWMFGAIFRMGTYTDKK